MRHYRLTWDEVGQLPYSRAFALLEMAVIEKAMEQGVTPKTLLSSFELYQQLAPIHKDIIEKAERHGRINSK